MHKDPRHAHLPIREGKLGLTSSDAMMSSLINETYTGCQALSLGRVIEEASVQENLPCLLERLPGCPVALALVDELQSLAAY